MESIPKKCCFWGDFPTKVLARNARNVALSFDISRRRKIHLTFEDD